jgi:hypothetical protein
MANYKTKDQVNLNWVQTFQMKSKAPAVANRIFEYFTDAQSYVDNIKDSATEGIRITVLKDYILIPDTNGVQPNGEGYIETKEYGYAGVYYVKSIGDGENPGELVKIGRGDVAWFKGNGIEEDGTENYLKTAKVGDLYYHTKNLDIFQLIEEETKLIWKKIGNLGITSVNKTVPYYKLSEDGMRRPEFSIDKWVEGNEDGNNIPNNYEDFDGKSVYLWTRFYEEGETKPKYTVALVHSSLNLGTFNL